MTPHLPTIDSLATGEDREIARAWVTRARVILFVKTNEDALALVNADVDQFDGSILRVYRPTVLWPSRTAGFFQAAAAAHAFFSADAGDNWNESAGDDGM